jgi:hypothetical protein
MVGAMRRAAALLAVILAAAACSTSAGRPGPGTARAESTSPADAPGAVAAPFGTVDLVGGGQIDGAELAGRDVALWFWAPW